MEEMTNTAHVPCVCSHTGLAHARARDLHGHVHAYRRSWCHMCDCGRYEAVSPDPGPEEYPPPTWPL